MKIVLARIDDRFIHGQVTVGWSQSLRPDLIILANNEIAADSWQSRVYGSSVPPEIQVTILGTSQAATRLSRSSADSEQLAKAFLLTGSPSDMLFIHRYGARIAEVNIGGMHYAPGKKEMLPYVYVDAQDLQAFSAFLEEDIKLWAQQLPGTRRTQIDRDMIGAMEARI